MSKKPLPKYASTRITEEERNKIDELAEVMDVPPSIVIRRAIRQYLAAQSAA